MDQPQKRPCENAAETGHRIFIYSENNPWAETPLSEEDAFAPGLGEGPTLEKAIDFVLEARTVKMVFERFYLDSFSCFFDVFL